METLASRLSDSLSGAFKRSIGLAVICCKLSLRFPVYVYLLMSAYVCVLAFVVSVCAFSAT